jgi:hypothetical protein
VEGRSCDRNKKGVTTLHLEAADGKRVLIRDGRSRRYSTMRDIFSVAGVQANMAAIPFYFTTSYKRLFDLESPSLHWFI